MENNYNLLTNIISDLGINTTEIRLPILTNKDFPDHNLRSTLFGEDAPFREDLAFSEKDGKRLILMITDDFKCNYILGRWDKDNSYRILGPFLYGRTDPLLIRKRLTEKGIRTDISYLQSYYHNLPVIRDENLLHAVIQAYCISRFGAEGFELISTALSLNTVKEYTASGKEYSGYQIDLCQETHAREKLLMNAISEGNYSQSIFYINRLSIHNPENRALNTLRDMKNYLIVLNTICRLAARNGGAHIHEIDRFSNDTVRRIENSPSIEVLKEIRTQLIKAYCDMVANARSTSYSPSVSQITDYISSHYAEEISLSEAARLFNMSHSYLSSRFHKETGMTFSDFVLKKKLDHAKVLLKNTQIPVSMIAEDCGIQDNNYFSRIFKKKEGMTPLEYRNKNRKDKSSAPFIRK